MVGLDGFAVRKGLRVLPKITLWFCLGMFVGVVVFVHGLEVGNIIVND